MKSSVTPASLRAEGILELGRALGTGLLFVLTKKKLHLFHIDLLPDRVLDGYAVALAVNWIENGQRTFEVARDLGVCRATLQQALSQAGYERLSPLQKEHLVQARKLRKPGNRRGRLVRVGEGVGA